MGISERTSGKLTQLEGMKCGDIRKDKWETDAAVLRRRSSGGDVGTREDASFDTFSDSARLILLERPSFTDAYYTDYGLEKKMNEQWRGKGCTEGAGQHLYLHSQRPSHATSVAETATPVHSLEFLLHYNTSHMIRKFDSDQYGEVRFK